MKTLLIVSVFLFSVSCLFSTSGFAQKNPYIDGKGINFLTGLMMYPSEADPDKYKAGLFLAFEYEQPLNKKGGFRLFFVPELTYWGVENTKNLALGINMRGKFIAGSIRPYLDAGVTINRLSRADVEMTIGGINAGGGIQFPLQKTNIAVIVDFKVRAHLVDSKFKAGFSFAPGIRIGF